MFDWNKFLLLRTLGVKDTNSRPLRCPQQQELTVVSNGNSQYLYQCDFHRLAGLAFSSVQCPSGSVALPPVAPVSSLLTPLFLSSPHCLAVLFFFLLAL